MLVDSPKMPTFATLSKTTSGKMPERSIGTVSKTVVPLRVPRVRIPVFPQPTDHKTGLETLKTSDCQTVLRFFHALAQCLLPKLSTNYLVMSDIVCNFANTKQGMIWQN